MSYRAIIEYCDVIVYVVDRSMDQIMYADSGVVFVRDSQEMARKVEELLVNETKLKALGTRNKIFIETKVRTNW